VTWNASDEPTVRSEAGEASPIPTLPVTAETTSLSELRAVRSTILKLLLVPPEPSPDPKYQLCVVERNFEVIATAEPLLAPVVVASMKICAYGLASAGARDICKGATGAVVPIPTYPANVEVPVALFAVKNGAYNGPVVVVVARVVVPTTDNVPVAARLPATDRSAIIVVVP
jgi:hypothetical protein